MKKWAFILFIALLSASCDSLLSSKPSDTLTEQQMTDVLVDIHLTEATLKIADETAARLNDTTQLRMRFAQVFIKHDINPDDFNTSLTYYLEHIEEIDKIYVEVISRLTEIEAKLQPKPAPNIAKARNIHKAALSKNIWYRITNKIEEPKEIFYFGPMQYPIERKVNIPEASNYN